MEIDKLTKANSQEVVQSSSISQSNKELEQSTLVDLTHFSKDNNVCI